MKNKNKDRLSRRESQIIEVVYRLGEATVADIAAQIPEKIGVSSISKFLWLLEEKGLVAHHRSGKRNVYRPALPPEQASEKPLQSLMKTFFQGSAATTVVALLNQSRDRLSDDEIDDLFDLIKQFKERGK